jgi:hypothetical protein
VNDDTANYPVALPRPEDVRKSDRWRTVPSSDWTYHDCINATFARIQEGDKDNAIFDLGLVAGMTARLLGHLDAVMILGVAVCRPGATAEDRAAFADKFNAVNAEIERDWQGR